MSAPLSLRAAVLVSLLVPLAGCEAPPVQPTQDPVQAEEAATTRIEGSVVVVGKARGNVLVFLYDASNPPPPQGTGRPLTFTLLPEETVFGANPDPNFTGPFTAPFTLSRIKPGHYLVRGLIDRRGCLPAPNTAICREPDFIPWFYATNEPNAGDVGGAAVDPVKGTVRVVEVPDISAPVTGVTVSFQEVAPFAITTDRPTFSVTGTTGSFVPSKGAIVFNLTTTPIAEKVVDERMPFFLAKFVDDNGDNQPDDTTKVWPKLVIRKLDSNTLSNLVEETGVRYERFDGSPTPATGSDVVSLGGSIAADVAPQLLDAGGQPLRDQNGALVIKPLNTVKVTLYPLAYDISNPAAPVRLKTVPPGRYAIIVLNLTGQSWRVPNEMSPAVVKGFSSNFKMPAVDSQAFFIEVPPGG